MDNNTFAKLGFKEGTLILELQRENEPSKEIFRDSTAVREITRIADTLNFLDMEHMLSQINLGDEAFMDVERSYEDELILNTDSIRSIQEEFEHGLDPNLNTKVKEELVKNHINDLAASYSESVYDSIAFKILSKVSELVIDELKIAVETMQNHERLITVLSQNAPELDIKVTLI